MPLQPMVRRQAVSPQPMEVSGGADAHLQPGEEPMMEQLDAPQMVVTPWESPRWSSLCLKGVGRTLEHWSSS